MTLDQLQVYQFKMHQNFQHLMSWCWNYKRRICKIGEEIIEYSNVAGNTIGGEITRGSNAASFLLELLFSNMNWVN